MNTNNTLRGLFIAAWRIWDQAPMRSQPASSEPQTHLKAPPYRLALLAVLLVLSLLIAPKSAYANSCLSNATGDWGAAGTWTGCGNTTPQPNDTVTIQDGHIVTINIPATISGLTVGQGTSGILQFSQTSAVNFAVNGDVNISSGGTFQSSNAGSVTGHLLSLNGNLTNNGTLDFSTNGNGAGAGITFTGATNTTFSGTGSITDIRTITVNKGTSSANVLELSASNFTVRGAITDVAGYLTLQNGTFKLSGSFSGTNRVFNTSNYSIPATAGFWLNNPNYSVAGQAGTATVSGSLRISSGIFNVGTADTHNLQYDGTTSSITIDGGTLNIASRFKNQGVGTDTVVFSMSGGALTVTTISSMNTTEWPFDIPATASSFIVSGGTIIIEREGGTGLQDLGYRNLAATTNVTGGTLQVGDATTPSANTMRINSTAAIYNLTVNGSTGGATKPTAILDTNGLTVLNSVTIDPGTTLNANGLNLNVGGDWTNNGTWTAGTPGTTTFNGTSTQTLSKSGTGSTETFCNLTIAANAFVDTTDDFVGVTNSGSCLNLTQNGILKRTAPAQNINSGSPFTFKDSRLVDTAVLTLTAGTLGSTTVEVVSNQSPNASPCGNHYLNGAPILRWYNITAASGGTATVRLYYRTSNPDERNGTTAADIRIFHCNGTTWAELGGTPGSDGFGNFVELEGVTTFSPFALAPNGTPTNADLAVFRTLVTKNQKVRVKWTTSSELTTVGFNIHRAKKQDGKFKKQNAELIPAKHPGILTGTKYKYGNKNVKPGMTYFYKLEVVKVDGTSEWSEVSQIRVP